MDLDKAIEIAVQAHRGVLDKGGNPYILHPLRVMLSLQSEEERIVAVLHDVVEDSDWTFEELANEGFAPTVIDALISVTKTSVDEDYQAFISRALKNPIGRKVKIADITDNLDVRRMSELNEKDLSRLNKYLTSLEALRADHSE